MTNQILSGVHLPTHVLHYFSLTYLHIKIFVCAKQKYLTLIPCERKPFWHLRQLEDFPINALANLYVHERLEILEAYSEPIRKSKIDLFVKIS